MSQINLISKEIPIEQIEEDKNQPRSDFNTKGERNRFLLSIKENGILDRLAVSRSGKNKYVIIDGHRRYLCAKELGFKTVPCDIYPENIDNPEFDRTRFELQNDRREWKPFERSKAIQRINKKKKFSNNKQLADYLHLSPNAISNSLKFQSLRNKYSKLTEKYNLPETYLIEFIRLQPKIRPIKEFTVEQIIWNILERAQYKIIDCAKDFRLLGSIFLRARANERELCRFLKNQDMTIKELAMRTNRSAFVRDVENVMQQISERRSKDIQFSSEDQTTIHSLYELIKSTFDIS